MREILEITPDIYVGREQIYYDLPVMEKYLGNTYGITVYQEQVMKLSQELVCTLIKSLISIQ